MSIKSQKKQISELDQALLENLNRNALKSQYKDDRSPESKARDLSGHPNVKYIDSDNPTKTNKKKRLVALISTEGKNRDQLVNETWEAYQKYLKAQPKK